MKNLIHAFNVDLAMQIGVEEAIIIHQFMFWIDKSEANGKNFHNGAYWTYNSLPALRKLFPYMSESTIKRKIQQLLKLGLLVVGQFHKDKSDRSNWYSIDQVILNRCHQVNLTLPSGQSDPIRPVQNDPMYINSSNNSSNTVVESDSLETKKQQTQQYSSEANFSALYASYPRKMGRRAALKHFQTSVKTEQDLADIHMAMNNYLGYLKKNSIELQYTQNASTWFNNWKDWANDYWIKQTTVKTTGAGGREL